MNSNIALVVDDEPESREGLIRIIPWQEIGFDVVLEASNGMQALELIAEYKPALIVTDLIMPISNGIELMRELTRMRLSAKVIVISGYNEFQYVRESLRLGAVDYILKPFRTHEVLPVVNQCVEEIRLSQLADLKKQKEQEKYIQALSLLQDKFVKEIVTGYMNNSDKIRNTLDQASLSWMLHHQITVLSMEIDNFMSEFTPSNKELMIFAISNVARDSISNQLPFHLYYNHSGRWILILGSGYKEKVKLVAMELIENIGRFVKLAVTIGAGPVCTADTLPVSYVSSLEALEYKTILGGNQILFSDEVNLHPLGNSLQSSPIEQEILSILKTGAVLNKDEFRPKLIELLHSWGEHKKDTIQQRLFEWLLKMERQLKIHNSNLNVIGNESLLHWKLFSQFDTRDSIIDYSLHILEQMTVQNYNVQSNQLGQITSRALYLIEENCTTNGLTLASLAEMVFVSPVWLSHLLKEKTGKTFLEILTEHRMERAKQLLMDLSLKSYEVAEKVGYKDTDYFTKQFKKYTAMTPGEFRNRS